MWLILFPVIVAAIFLALKSRPDFPTEPTIEQQP